VDATGGHIGCYEHPIAAFLESAQRLVALVLAAIAVNRCRLDTLVPEPSCQAVGAMFSAGEYQEGAFLTAQQAPQQFELAILLDFAD
jgi:hypothetical protein